MGYFKNQKIITQFGKRLQSFRLAADLSQEQVHLATGIGQSHIANTESGKVNTSISHIALYAELFGVKEHEMLNFDAPVPDAQILKRNVSRFLESHGFSSALFLKQTQGATHIIENKLIKTDFLDTPRFSKEIADHCKEVYNADFTTTQISKVLDGLHKKGMIEKIETDKKSKFQYRRIK